MTDFKEKLKTIFNNDPFPKPRYDCEGNEVTEKTKGLYNIHKRSLPVGVDEIKYFGLTKENAEQLLKMFLKPKTAIIDGNYRLYYYDIVPVDADVEEKSVYWNPKGVLCGSGEDQQQPIQWQD